MKRVGAIILAVALLSACAGGGAQPANPAPRAQVVGRIDRGAIDYSLIYYTEVQGMPCLFTTVYAGLSMTCDWSKWTGNP